MIIVTATDQLNIFTCILKTLFKINYLLFAFISGTFIKYLLAYFFLKITLCS